MIAVDADLPLRRCTSPVMPVVAPVMPIVPIVAPIVPTVLPVVPVVLPVVPVVPRGHGQGQRQDGVAPIGPGEFLAVAGRLAGPRRRQRHGRDRLADGGEPVADR